MNGIIIAMIIRYVMENDFMPIFNASSIDFFSVLPDTIKLMIPGNKPIMKGKNTAPKILMLNGMPIILTCPGPIQGLFTEHPLLYVTITLVTIDTAIIHSNMIFIFVSFIYNL